MRKFMIQVNGNSYEVEVEEINAQSAPQPAAAPTVAAQPVAAPQPQPAAPQPKPAASVPAGGTQINSPMPGVILSVDVNVGQAVSEGDTLMILEAMKMENEILAPSAGTVKAVGVEKGASVETGDLLVVIG